MHDRPEIGRICPARHGDAQDLRNVRHTALVCFGVRLVVAHFCGVAEACGNLLDLGKPSGGIVRGVVRGFEAFQHRSDDFRRIAEIVFGREGIVEEIGQERNRLFCRDEVLTALFAADAHAQGKDFQHIFPIRKMPFFGVRSVVLRPVFEEIEHLFGGEGGKRRLGHVVEFEDVEQSAAFAHLADERSQREF